MVEERPRAVSGLPRPEIAAVAGMLLGGRRLGAARAAWLALAALSLGLSAAMVPASFSAYGTICANGDCQLTPQQARALLRLGISVHNYAIFNVALSVVFLLVSCALAAVIFWRKSNNWMALLVALLLVAIGGTFVAAPLEYSAQAWRAAANVSDKLDLALVLLICTLFPSGRFVPRWSGWLSVAWLAIQLPLAIYPELPAPDWLVGLSYLGFFGAVILAQIYRFRHVSGSREREQTKWVVTGIVVTLLADLVIWLT